MSGGPNPFLLPGSQPGRPRPSGDPDPAVESGTRKVPRAAEPASASDPAPAGELPAAEATILRPGGAGSDAPSPVPGTRWRLVLPDGVEIPLDAALLLGREPVAPEGVRGARPIAVRDAERTVSKTHALLTPVASGVRVRDLHSSNGTTLVLAAGRAPVPAGGDVLVTQDAVLELGRFAVRLRP